MTVEGFRKVALSMPESAEGSHMGHPDFRVRGRIFATLPGPRRGLPDEPLGMVKLTPEGQGRFVMAAPGAFVTVGGAWGKNGATLVRLGKVDRATLRRAVLEAWRNTAPRRMVEELGPLDAG